MDHTTGLVGDNPDLTKFNRFYRTMPGPPPGAVKAASTLPALGPSFVTSPHLS